MNILLDFNSDAGRSGVDVVLKFHSMLINTC
uniref:Uncharacterized protein n=1 Tax=Siphoviridae sp. ct75s2 TaxID=2825348 RepID=A0A8S5Q0V6_9CAUD|nr:MAG TPA: hypothetical protein [Siphoviridae sp. ct75s2]